MTIGLNCNMEIPPFLFLQLRDLEGELEMEARRRSDAEKAVRRQERRVKEIIFQSEEDRKITERIQESCDKLTIKCKTLKRQLEESVSHSTSY